MPKAKPKPRKAAAPKSLAQRASRSVRPVRRAKPVSAPVHRAKATPAAVPLSAEQQRYRSAGFFALGIVALSLLLFVTVSQIAENAKPMSVVAPVSRDATLAALKANGSFLTWIARWQTADPYVGQSELTMKGSGSIAASDATINAEELQRPTSNRYVWSPDNARFVDYLAHYGEAATTVTVYNRTGNSKLETLATCDRDCGFDTVFWLSKDRVVVAGHAGGGKASHLTATVYDFATSRQQTYVSNDHQFASNPFDAEARQRWLSGLTEEQQKAVGQAPIGETVVLRGSIIGYAQDSRILSLALEGGTQRFVTLVPTAIIHGTNGVLMDATLLAKGSGVEVTAVDAGDFSLSGLSLKVLVDAPTEPAKTQSSR